MNSTDMLSTVFPSVGMRVLSNCISFFGVSACAFCFARRSASINLFSLRALANMSWARMCVYLLFIDSWLFLGTSWLLINGVGMSRSDLVCGLGIYACIFAYASTKFLIYLFLTEKVHVVWGKGKNVPRFSSNVYRLCAVVLAVYIAVFVIIIVGKVAFLREDRTCMIGLKTWASIPLLTYDLAVNVLLTALFLWPLVRTKVRSTRLRRVTVRTLIAAIVSLATSTVNILILTMMHGHQLGWVCLGSCGTDVIVNAVVLYWVTEAAPRQDAATVELAGFPATPATPNTKFSMQSPTRQTGSHPRSFHPDDKDYDSDTEFTSQLSTGYSGAPRTRPTSVAALSTHQPFALAAPPKAKAKASASGESSPRSVTFTRPTPTPSKPGLVGTLIQGLNKQRKERDDERQLRSMTEPTSPIRITVTTDVHDPDTSDDGKAV